MCGNMSQNDGKMQVFQKKKENRQLQAFQATYQVQTITMIPPFDI